MGKYTLWLGGGMVLAISFLGTACSDTADSVPAPQSAVPTPVETPSRSADRAATPSTLVSILAQPVRGDCIEGTWLSDNQLFAAALNNMGAGEGLEVIDDVTGEVFLTFGPDGSLVTEYRNWRLLSAQDGAPLIMERHGSDFGAYTLGGDGTISFADQRMESTLTMAAADFTMEVDPHPTAYSAVPYSCDGDVAVLSTPDGTATLYRRY